MLKDHNNQQTPKGKNKEVILKIKIKKSIHSFDSHISYFIDGKKSPSDGNTREGLVLSSVSRDLIASFLGAGMGVVKIPE